MTDRLNAITVVLEKDIREDDAQTLMMPYMTQPTISLWASKTINHALHVLI